MTANAPLFESNLTGLTLMNRGKVRDIYAIDDDYMLIVASDRLSAFDVVLSDPIPDKGRVLTAVSDFWFARTGHIITNHLCELSLTDVVPDPEQRASVAGQATVVRRVEPLPVEAIVRGYIIGSGWKDYQASGEICGIKLPEGLRQADKLPEAIYTPSTKAEIGEHDENIAFDATVSLLGVEMAERVRDISLELYTEAANFARERGIIIADTKFEFGLDADGNVVLIDEVLTPDSSRFWPADTYQPGTSPMSFDKQYVRDYLETLAWNKSPPAPKLPSEVIEKTTQKYQEAERRLVG